MTEKTCMDYELSNKMEDVVHPSYYEGDKCLKLMEAMFGKDDVEAFCRCNSFKYRFRAGKKPGANAADDIKKAEFYEDYLLELIKRWQPF